MSRTFVVCLSLLALCIFAGCGEKDAPSNAPAPPPVSSSPTPAMTVPPPGQKPGVDASKVSGKDRLAAVDACNDFGLGLYHQAKGGKGNVFFSPFSIHQAVTLAYIGAAGKTAEEMRSVLHVQQPDERFLPATGALIQDVFFPGGKPEYVLVSANALWGQERSPVEQEYMEKTNRFLGARWRKANFKTKPVLAVRRINAWVSDRTGGRITELVSPAMITPNTRLIITNAVYFKGTWKHPFKTTKTSPGPFQLLDGTTTSVPMMRQKGYFTVRDQGLCRALVLPYLGKRIEMVVVLPKQADGIENLDEDISRENLAAWLGGPSRAVETQVALPRFKLECTVPLKSLLTAMGMVQAFDSRKADFSGVSNVPEGLFVGEAVHKAYVDVNEQGTEAAAATGMTLDKKSEPYSFVVDRPFLFFIRDKKTGIVLFFGRCLDPTP